MTALSPIDVLWPPVIGAVAGLAYFLLLLRTIRWHAAGVRAGVILPFYLLRLGVVVLAFWVIAQEGALPLVLALLGFLAARSVIQRRIGFS